jgi:hypothetical protein
MSRNRVYIFFHKLIISWPKYYIMELSPIPLETFPFPLEIWHIIALKNSTCYFNLVTAGRAFESLRKYGRPYLEVLFTTYGKWRGSDIMAWQLPRGILHEAPDGGPSVTIGQLTQWSVYGVPHRDGLPAIIYKDGTVAYYRWGVLHRGDDEPAFIRFNGAKVWYTHGSKLRDNGMCGPGDMWCYGYIK